MSNLYVGPGWCGEREHHPPHDSCRGYGMHYRAATKKEAQADELGDAVLAAGDQLIRDHGESCDCDTCLVVQPLVAIVLDARGY